MGSNWPIAGQIGRRVLGGISLQASILSKITSMWELEEASGTRSDAHGSNDLTDVNTVGQASGKVGNAADFEEAADEHLKVATNSSLEPNNESIYWALFIKYESFPTGNNHIIDKNTSAEAFGLYKDGSHHPRFYVNRDSVNTNADWGAAISTATWYFIEGYYDHDRQKVGVCIDRGTDVELDQTNGIQPCATDLFIGAFSNPHAGNFDGIMDQIFYAKGSMLTQDERDWLYNNGDGRAYSEINP